MKPSLPTGRWRRLAGAAALMPLVAGCGANQCAQSTPDARPGGQAELVVVTGTVESSGLHGAGFVTLTPDRAAPIRLEGPLLQDLVRLDGAVLAVAGTPSGAPPYVVEVRGYTVLEVNGERPEVGVLAESGGRLRLERALGALPLVQATAGLLRELVGATVWITGPMAGDALTVQSFGVIRPR